MNVNIYSFPRSFLPDSLYLCPDSVEINVELGEVDYLWSTGDTTQRIIVKETGSYWLQITNSLGLDISDTIIVYRPSSIEISGSYQGNMEFCADTLLVVGDCNFRGITLKPGTFILFKGDYTIMMDFLKSVGTETDSITFCGSILPNDTIKQGSLEDRHSYIWQNPSSQFRLTNLINIKYADLHYAAKCSILECGRVSLRSSSFNKVLRNNTVIFDCSVDNCQVIENKLMYFIPNDTRFLPTEEFFCTNSTFRRNASGLNAMGGDVT